MSNPPTTSPVVIGAGVAGLAAAVELARRGARPHLLEARPFVGGRVRSFVHAATGDEIDNGQHLMMGCYHDTFRLLEEIGTRHHVAIQRRLSVGFRDADGTIDRLDASPSLPSPLDVLWGMLRLRGLSPRERVGLVRVARAAMRPAASPDETVTSLLARLGQSERAQRRLWDPIVIATLNTAPHEASSELFLAIMRRAFLGRGDDSRLAIPRVGLSKLLEPAVDYITANDGSVALATSVLRIEALGDHYRIHVKDRESIETGEVIVALPPRGASTLLAPLGISIDSEPLALSPIVSLYLWYDRDLSPIPELTALLGTSVQWVFNRRAMLRQTSAASPGLLSCTISAADAAVGESSEAVIALADRELREAFEELAGARLLDALVVKEKQATFRARPGLGARRPSTVTARSGIYLAGDWTATGLPATIEGAAGSGFAAAEALLDHRLKTGAASPPHDAVRPRSLS